jgi:hypothetical protein
MFHWTSLAFPHVSFVVPKWLAAEAEVEMWEQAAAEYKSKRTPVTSGETSENLSEIPSGQASEKMSGETSEKASGDACETMSGMPSGIASENVPGDVSGQSAKLLEKSTARRSATRPKKRPRKCPEKRCQVIAYSDAFIRTHGRAPTGREIRTQYPDMPRQTAHDYAVRARARVGEIGTGVVRLEDARRKRTAM